MSKTIPKKRAELLMKLEELIGSECYNANIQNWGPHGVFEGEGRDFRYPITYVNEKGDKVKRKWTDTTMPASVAMTGHYAFGANQLHVMRGLEKVLSYLEKQHGLQI